MSRVVCWATFALAAGIAFGHWLLFSFDMPCEVRHVVVVACAVILACAILSYVPYPNHTSLSRFRDLATVATTVVCFFAVGVARYGIYFHRHLHTGNEGRCHVEGIVITPPANHGRRTSFVIETAPPASRHVLLNIWHDSDDSGRTPQLGELVTADGTLSRPRNLGNPDEFDYATWLWCQGIGATASVSSSAVCLRAPNDDECSHLPLMTRLRLGALKLRNRLVSRLASSGLDGQSLAIVSALTLADRSQLTSEMRDLYAEAGASHLLALSGLHLGVIIGLLLMLIYSNLRASSWRVAVCVLTLVLIWGFSFVAGLPTSLVRASTMTSLALTAAILNREGVPGQHLVLAVAAMLLANPTYLLDVGAQLSVAAVAGIIFFYAPVQRWASRKWRFGIHKLRRRHLYAPLQLVHVSLAAQVLTMPIAAWHFNQVPIYGPLASVILVPLTTALIYSALVLLVVGGMFPWLTTVLSSCVTHLVGLQVFVLNVVAALPGAVVSDFWSHKSRQEIVVYNSRQCPAMHVIDSPEQSWLLMPHPERGDTAMRYIANSFWAKRLTAKPEVLSTRRTITYNGFRAVMLSEPYRRPLHATAPAESPTPSPPSQIDIELLWLCDGFSGRLTDVLASFRPRCIVLDASLPAYQRRDLCLEAARLHVPVYDIHERGALRLKLE